jgi:exodeoxyribonuclease-3
MTSIATWNVNSITARLPHVLDFLKDTAPDILLLQELKCIEGNFPFMELKAAGYQAAVYGQKSWNGVAILSRHEITDVKTGLSGLEDDEQARYIGATVQGLRVASIYLPNGNPVDSEKYPYKLKWFDHLIAHARTLLSKEIPVVLGGDYNVIPEARDCFDPELWKDDALFRMESRRKWRALINLGFTDAFRAFNDKDHQYSFWDYQAGAWPKNNGIRIDHFALSPQAADLAENCVIDTSPRGKDKASDHTPVILTLAATQE